jgi:hypothetical protein
MEPPISRSDEIQARYVRETSDSEMSDWTLWDRWRQQLKKRPWLGYVTMGGVSVLFVAVVFFLWLISPVF